MNGRKTDPQEAATVVAMSEGGYGPSAISRNLEMPRSTVNDILHGRSGWDKIHDQVWFREYVNKQRVSLQASLTEIAKRGLIRVDETIDKASTGQAMWAAAVAIDKARLLAGESTENIAHAHRHEVVAKDEVAARVLASLANSVSPTQAPTEVQPNQVPTDTTDPNKTP